MRAEDAVREALGRGKPGEALLALARIVDSALAEQQDPWALPVARREGPPATLDGVDATLKSYYDAPIRETLEGPPAMLTSSEGREWEVYPGFTLDTAAFGWDGSPDTWTKDIGEDMYREALRRIGDPLPGDEGEWAARRQLAQDLRTPPTRNVLYREGETIRSQGYVRNEDDDPVMIDLPAPTAEQREWRRAFAEQMGWDRDDWLLPSGGQPIIDTFIEGGPLVFFHGYREYLGNMPLHAIRALIQHWADCGYPNDAAIMTADLLRYEDELNYDRALEDAGSRSATLPGGRGGA